MTDLEQDILSKIEALRTYCGMKILEHPTEEMMHMRIELNNLAIKFNRLVKIPSPPIDLTPRCVFCDTPVRKEGYQCLECAMEESDTHDHSAD